jgi:hypothetical protein
MGSRRGLIYVIRRNSDFYEFIKLGDTVPMMEIWIVVLIVAVAAFYVGRVFYRGLTRKGDCACGCSGCSLGDSPAAPPTDNTGSRIRKAP